jgi:hypothetical protein
MVEIPKEFRDIPEAARLRRADAELSAAARKALEAVRESRVDLIGEQHLRRARTELQEAQRAYDAATGEPKPVGLTPAVVAEVERQFPASQVQEVIDLLDRSCGRTLPFFRDATAQKLERIRLCALKVGSGDLVRLRQAVELANTDWRDLICAADIK